MSGSMIAFLSVVISLSGEVKSGVWGLGREQGKLSAHSGSQQPLCCPGGPPRRKDTIPLYPGA